MMPIAKQKEIQLELRSDDGQEVEVLGDKERLTQVITNLIDNAIKYTDRKGSVDIEYHVEDEHVRVSVSDTGCGMSREHVQRIFERFYTVDKVRSREVGGTGLGLAIVKHIVEAHGSEVSVTSELGKGSTFSFMLKK